MNVTWATLPGTAQSQDRVFVTTNAVVVLDGASVCDPVPTSQYVDGLGADLVAGLTNAPHADLTPVLADAIAQTAARMGLRPGASPSSTVAIARTTDDGAVDLLVLGDSQIVTPTRTYRDTRIHQVAVSHRAAYRDRLAAGHGYDEAHQLLLRALQVEEARHRNTADGFWIAEADPAAAAHAVTARLAHFSWLVLATDGAYCPMQHLHRDNWPSLVGATSDDLTAVLVELARWEADDDPAGRARPRAKLHDDKTLAVVTAR
ncbi:MAG: hypothetical protein FWE61_06430 [Micrococcales bacterium]|nr:hypothetical protein [Micrococcales bacterium]